MKRAAAPAATVPLPPPATDAASDGGWFVARRLVAFVFAGGIGFGVDLLGTLTLINFGLAPFLARALAIAAALLATYAINRGVTFRTRASQTGLGVAREGARYAAVGIATSVLNWLVFVGVLAVVPGLHPGAALIVSSAVAMVASYLGYARFAFRG